MHVDGIIKLIVLIRETIEFENAQSKYPTLNLYCNWRLHTQISGSATAYRMLLKITESISKADTPEKTDIAISEVNAVLSLPNSTS